jgi:tetratricopeptide (TPR) repeat protein
MHLRSSLAALILLLTTAGMLAPASGATPTLDQVQSLLDRGQVTEALEALKAVLKRDKKNAKALLMRSTAHFVLGDEARGVADLDRALELDPTLRQGWLNRAALAMADENYPAALASLLRAQELDPAADDNFLNIGAVRLLMGQLDEASRDFESYVQRNPRPGSVYLVASNYAMAGYPGLAIRYLHQAIQMDERVRVRARADPNFFELEDHPRFQELMLTDSYQPPPGAHRASRSYALPYERGDGPLLQATLDALHALRMSYEPRVEVTPDWALVWSDVRIKVSDAPDGGGRLELTAPPDAMTAADFEARAKSVLDRVFIEVARRGTGGR